MDVGQKAPQIEAKDHEGRPVSLEALCAKGPVVLYFYPKDFTPGCTREACMFRDAFSELTGTGASIVGVSIDDDESHRRFAERYQLPYSLVSDPDRAIATRYGITRIFGLGARRVTFVIDRKGVVHSKIHSELSMSRHVEDARAAIAAIG